jgi:hypothetical protein
MFISKLSIQSMLNQITSQKDFSDMGHDGDNLAIDLVQELSDYIKEGPDNLFIPDAVLPYIKISLIGDIVRGLNRPLIYLCSDCKYPKWAMTMEEAKEYYQDEHWKEYIRDDGFIDMSGACPKCGD